MKHILLIGAGRSTGSLVKYLIDNANENTWDIKIADRDFSFIKSSYFDLEYVHRIEFDVTNETQRNTLIQSSDIVISMLPAHMHIEVAKDCISAKKHMVTASYVSPEMRALESDAKAAGVIIVNEKNGKTINTGAGNANIRCQLSLYNFLCANIKQPSINNNSADPTITNPQC